VATSGSAPFGDQLGLPVEDRQLEPFMMFMGEPSHAARAIGRALTARSPRARYLVGQDAQAIAASQPFVPGFVRDRATRIILGI